MDEELIVVLCNVPADGETPSRLARGLVEACLAACVSRVGGMVSHYRWEGEAHADPEVQLLIKTRASLFESVAAWLQEHHPYDVPEVIALPVAAAEQSYLRWVLTETEAPSHP